MALGGGPPAWTQLPPPNALPPRIVEAEKQAHKALCCGLGRRNAVAKLKPRLSQRRVFVRLVQRDLGLRLPDDVRAISLRYNAMKSMFSRFSGGNHRRV